MNYSIQTINSEKQVIIEDGTTIHQIPLQAISSWGFLLGISDPVEILEKILSYKEPDPDSGEENIWGPLYETLGEGLDKMAAAGVPPELMELLLDPELESPIPGKETLDKIATTQDESKAIIDSCTPSVKLSDLRGIKEELDKDFSDQLQAKRTEFIDTISPTYEVVVSSPEIDIPQ